MNHTTGTPGYKRVCTETSSTTGNKFEVLNSMEARELERVEDISTQFKDRTGDSLVSSSTTASKLKDMEDTSGKEVGEHTTNATPKKTSIAEGKTCNEGFTDPPLRKASEFGKERNDVDNKTDSHVSSATPSATPGLPFKPVNTKKGFKSAPMVKTRNQRKQDIPEEIGKAQLTPK